MMPRQENAKHVAEKTRKTFVVNCCLISIEQQFADDATLTNI